METTTTRYDLNVLENRLHEFIKDRDGYDHAWVERHTEFDGRYYSSHLLLNDESYHPIQIYDDGSVHFEAWIDWDLIDLIRAWHDGH